MSDGGGLAEYASKSITVQDVDRFTLFLSPYLYSYSFLNHNVFIIIFRLFHSFPYHNHNFTSCLDLWVLFPGTSSYLHRFLSLENIGGPIQTWSNLFSSNYSEVTRGLSSTNIIHTILCILLHNCQHFLCYHKKFT